MTQGFIHNYKDNFLIRKMEIPLKSWLFFACNRSRDSSTSELVTGLVVKFSKGIVLESFSLSGGLSVGWMSAAKCRATFAKKTLRQLTNFFGVRFNYTIDTQ